MATLGGLILVIQPSLLFAILDIDSVPAVTFVARLFGAFLIGLAAAIYSTRDLTGENIPLVLVIGNACVDFVTTLIFLEASLAGTLNNIGFILAGAFFMNLISWAIVLFQYSQHKKAPLKST